MQTTQFTDRNGKLWSIRITLGKSMLVDRSDFSIYTDQKLILSRFDRDSLTLILSDTPVMFAVLSVLLRDQALPNLNIDLRDEALASLSREDREAREARFQAEFAESIDGDTIEAARLALFEALSLFFPQQRTVFSTFLGKLKEANQKIGEAQVTVLNRQLDTMVQEEVDRILAIGTSTNSSNGT